MNGHNILLICCLFAFSLVAQDQSDGRNVQRMKIDELDSILREARFVGVFFRNQGQLADSVWNQGENLVLLENIVLDQKRSPEPRFLAAEVILSRAKDYPLQDFTPIYAQLYTYALLNSGAVHGDFGMNANMWGMIFDPEDPSGLGQRLLNFGRASIPPLTVLLTNDELIMYEGSQEAMEGNDYGFRIKDFAAFYILKIRGEEFGFQKDPKDRDEQIRKLQQTLWSK